MRFNTIDNDNSKIDKETSSKIILEANNLRDKIYLTTKLPCWLVKEKKDFYKLLNEHLENLRTDHLDFYLLHSLGFN